MPSSQQKEELKALREEAKKDRKAFSHLIRMAKRRGALVSITQGGKVTVFDTLKLLLVLALFSCSPKPFSKVVVRTAKDYQIKCTMDSLIIFDYGRRVGAAAYDSSMISGIILQDNE